MRLAIVRQRYNPYGGAERFVERAIAALAAERTEATIIARSWNAEHASGAAGVRICNPFHIGRQWRDRSFARAACALLATEKFDLVQSHERIDCCDIFRAGDGVHAQWLAHRGRALSTPRRVALLLSPYHRYVMEAERRMFESARLRAVICNSRMVRDDIRRHFDIAEAKLHVIYNGVDLEHFHPRLRAEHRATMRERLAIGADQVVYLFVGSGFERKGVPRLLRAFARLGDLNPALVIVGTDHSLAAAERLARRLGCAARVRFAGAHQDVRPYYGMADCFVLPTLYDPFPNASLEAMACGLPVVTSFQSGAAELVLQGVNGFCCDALDAPGLVASMHQAASLRGDGPRAAARRAVEGLSLDAMARQLVQLYRTLE